MDFQLFAAPGGPARERLSVCGGNDARDVQAFVFKNAAGKWADEDDVSGTTFETAEEAAGAALGRKGKPEELVGRSRVLEGRRGANLSHQ